MMILRGLYSIGKNTPHDRWRIYEDVVMTVVIAHDIG